MEDIETQRSKNQESKKLLHKKVTEIEKFIVDKYQRKRFLEEARLNALTYAESQLDWYNNCLNNLDSDQVEVDFYVRETVKWEKAINGTKNNDWSFMKEAFQEDARESYEGASQREILHEENSKVKSGDESERRADAFVRLANSLISQNKI